MIPQRLHRKLSHYWLVCECLAEMARARRALTRQPFAQIAPTLSLPLQSALTSNEQERVVFKVRAALGAIRRRIPWTPACLARAIAVHRVLARRSVPSQLTLSVTPASGKTVDAHAWLEAAGMVLTGRAEQHRYTAIHSFNNAATQVTSLAERTSYCSP